MKKIIWIKIARTGSTSVRDIFCNQIFKNKKKLIRTHRSLKIEYNLNKYEFIIIHDLERLKVFYKKFKKIFENAVIVCSIRNPIKRYISGVNFARRYKDKSIDTTAILNKKKFRHNKWVWVHVFLRIYDSLLKGKIKVNYWIRQEHIIQDMQSLCDKLNINIKIKNVHLNRGKYFFKKIDENVKNELEKHFEKDFTYYKSLSSS